MTEQQQLVQEARTAALRLFRKINTSGPGSLSNAEQKALSWAVRVIERPGMPLPDAGEEGGSDAQPAAVLSDR